MAVTGFASATDLIKIYLANIDGENQIQICHNEFES